MDASSGKPSVIPTYRKYVLFTGCKSPIALMQTFAQTPEEACQHLYCVLASPTSEQPWVLKVPQYLQNILHEIVIGAGGFDGEEIYYLTMDNDMHSISQDSIKLNRLLAPVLTSMFLNSLSATLMMASSQKSNNRER